MAGNKLGVFKATAKRLGITFQDYLEKVQSGNKYCYLCKTWKPITQFSLDRSRGDGHGAKCFSCTRVKTRKDTNGRPGYFKGHKHSEESRRKMSESRTGKPGNRTKRLTLEQKIKISQQVKKNTNYKGERHHNWKGGIKLVSETIRHSYECTVWRNAVFERDKYTCQKCGDKKGGNLQAHHIKYFSTHPELRFEIDNGITLCKTCHSFIHSNASKEAV